MLNPDISDSFKETITEREGKPFFSREEPSVITMQEENRQWGDLCWLCEQECAANFILSGQFGKILTDATEPFFVLPLCFLRKSISIFIYFHL